MVIRHQPSAPEGGPLWGENHAPDPDLLDLLGRPAWYADAACREHPELSWVDPGGSGGRVMAAKAVCAACPVRPECLATAVADPTLIGIWGATTTHERRALRHQPTRSSRRSLQLVTVSAVATLRASPHAANFGVTPIESTGRGGTATHD
jgi:WhiB family redox-sensing transcriptional regulator